MSDPLRRRLRFRIWRWLDRRSDALYDKHQTWAYQHEVAIDAATERLDRAVCALLGHVPIRDQCNLPAHDYCALCHSSTPEQATA